MNAFTFLKKSVLLILPIFMLAGVSCNNSDDDMPSNSTTSQTLVQDSGWKISYYFDKDKVETDNFAGFVFHFRDSGDFEATRNGDTTVGTWQVTSDDGSQRLVIGFATGTEPLDDLVDDWIIISLNDQKIELRDDNTEHLEELFFEAL